MSVYCPQMTQAIRHAIGILRESGIPFSENPDEHVTHLLYPAPTKADLTAVPPGMTVVGGNLPEVPGSTAVDLLKDPFYLAENAAITARCAIRLAQPTEDGILILGWGRIGKCLGRFLREQGRDVTIAVRKNEDLAMLQALGYQGMTITQANEPSDKFHIIFNTVPAMVLPHLERFLGCRAFELASKPGMAGGPIIDARGLPGKYAPTEQGALIAKTFIRLAGKEV